MDVRDHKIAPPLPGQEQFFIVALEQDGVDTKKRLEAIRQERSRAHEAQRTFHVDPRAGAQRRTYE